MFLPLHNWVWLINRRTPNESVVLAHSHTDLKNSPEATVHKFGGFSRWKTSVSTEKEEENAKVYVFGSLDDRIRWGRPRILPMSRNEPVSSETDVKRR